ncbi:MAG: glycerol-3-phosphate 1-O-acyltransferase PlsY [Mariprofundaceae bacterium]|nr:glycerol-3-phosphate 1-O-acyltransferase PlsY [Mariprofundaceae bacterium]
MIESGLLPQGFALSLEDILLIAVAYLLGATPFGLIFTRWLTGKDPREHGSGNIGATNVSRTGGKGIGLLTLAADIGKGALPVAWAVHAASETVIALAATAAFLGHIFPIYIGFKGGKGVATMFGVLLPWQPWIAAIAFCVWLLALRAWRYVALASILAGFSLPASAWLFHASTACISTSSLFCLLMLIRHHSNIRRMMAGEEDRVGQNSKRGS